MYLDIYLVASKNVERPTRHPIFYVQAQDVGPSTSGIPLANYPHDFFNVYIRRFASCPHDQFPCCCWFGDGMIFFTRCFRFYV